jgi:hypothetical protein
MTDELSVIAHLYDLVIWTAGRLEKFPRSHRFGVGRRIEEKLFDLLDLLLDAKYAHHKADILRQAALLVEQLRFLFRVSKDLHILAVNSHHHACERLDEIGREIGGWRRQHGRET